MYQRKSLLLIALISFVLFSFLLGFPYLVFNKLFIPPDSFSYIEASNMLFQNLEAHANRPLGFALLLGLPNLIFQSLTSDQYISFGLVLNFLSWGGSLFFFYKTISLTFGKKTSFWSTLLLILCVGSMAHVFLLLTESLVQFLLTLIAYLILKYHKHKKQVNLIAAASIMNGLVLIRPGFFYLSILFSILLLVFLIYKNRLWQAGTIGFVVSLLFVGLQLLVIQRTYGNLTPSYIDKIAWYKYLGTESAAAKAQTDFSTERTLRKAILKDKSWKETSAISVADMKDQLRHNLGNVWTEYLGNLKDNTKAGSYAIKVTLSEKIKKENIGNVAVVADFLFRMSSKQNSFFIALFVLSLFLMINYLRLENLVLGTLIITVAYVILTSGVSFWQGDRFHFILYPLIVIIFLNLAHKNPTAQRILEN